MNGRGGLTSAISPRHAYCLSGSMAAMFMYNLRQVRRCAMQKLLCDRSVSELVFDYGASWKKLSEKT